MKYPHIEYLSKIHNSKELSCIYGVSVVSINKVLKRLNIGAVGNIDQHAKNIIKLYTEGCSIKEISNQFNCTTSGIWRLLVKNGIDKSFNRLHANIKFNEYFFDSIDDEDKAYFLGVVASDGYNNIKNNVVSIRMTDLDVLQNFKRAILYNGEIRTIFVKGKKPIYKIAINSKHMSKSLLKYGVNPQKSKHFTIPNELLLPKILYNHFIRGYFDGDGCIYINKTTNKKTFSIVGNFFLLQDIQNIFKEYIDVTPLKIHKKANYIHDLRYSSTLDILKIKAYLYKDSTIYLERKFDKFNLIK